MDKPNYYGILPANVRYCKKLSPMAKILFTEITSLSNRFGYCMATNGYFAELYDKTDRTIQNWLEDLQKNGFILVEIERISGKGTYRKIYIKNTNIGGCKKFHPDMNKISPQKNNTSNNKEDKITKIDIDNTPRKKYHPEDKRTNKSLPFDIVTSSQTLRAFYGDNSEQLRNLVKECFDLETTHKEISDCINSFCTVAIATNEDQYKDYKEIREVEKLKGKFLRWIPTHIKYAEMFPKKYKPKKIKRKSDYDLDKYFSDVYSPKGYKRLKTSGQIEEDKELFSKEFDNLLEISSNYNNDNFNPMLVFEVIYKPLGNFLHGSTPTKKAKSLLRFMSKLNDYNQNRGDIRKLLKQAKQKQSL